MKQYSCSLAVLALLLLAQNAHAAVKTWSGTTDNTWNTGANWGGTAPATNDSLAFTSATGAGGLNLNNNLASFNVAGITFNAGAAAFVIGDGTLAANVGNTFVLTGNVTNSGTNLETINNPFSMTAVRTFTTTTGGGDITLGGDISGTGGGIIKAGVGTMTLSGANSYTGTSTVSGGTLNLNGTHTGAGAWSITNASTVNINGTETANGTFNVANGTAGAATVNVKSGGTLSIGGTSALIGQSNAAAVGTLHIENGGTVNVTTADFRIGNGANGTTGILTMDAGGQLTVSASATEFSIGNATNGGSNGVSGTLNLDGGVLTTSRNITNGAVANLAQTSLFNFNGGTLKAGANFSVLGAITRANVRDGGAIFDSNGFTITVAEPLLQSNIGGDVGTGGLTKNSAGTLILTGANTYTGMTTISGGTLQLGNAGTTGTLSTTSTIVNNGNLTISRTNAVTQGTDFSGAAITGTGSVTNASTGTLTLNAANTFSGGLNINNGTVSVGSIGNQASASSNAGGAYSTINIGATTTNGNLTYAGAGETSDRVINLAGTTGDATLDQSGTGLLKFTSNFTATGAGDKILTLQGSTASTGEIAGAIVDNSVANTTSLVKTGTGTWTLSGANSYTGTTTVNGGTLEFATGTSSIGRITVGNAAGTSTLKVTSGSLTTSTTGGSFILGSDAGATTNYTQNGGDVLLTGTGTVNVGEVNGNGVNFTLHGGTFTVQNNSATAATLGNVDALTYVQDGGTFSHNQSNTTLLNIAGQPSAPTTLAISGGTFQMTNGGTFFLGLRANAAMTISNTGLVEAAIFSFGRGGLGAGANSNDTLNLDGGTLQATQVAQGIPTGGSTITGNFNFNGGTLKAAAGANSTFMTGLSTATVKSGGAKIDTNGQAITIGQALLAGSPSGGLTLNDTAVTPGTLALQATAGANTYTGLTTITRGTLAYGTNNDQIATGGVTVNGSAAILSLGARSDTVGTVTLDGGGQINSTTGVLTSTGTFEMKSGSVSAILAGSGITLNKTTVGTVTFNGANANTYTGVTTISNGTLDLARTGGGNKSISGDGVPGTDDLVINGTGNVLLSDNEQIADAARVNMSSGSFMFNGTSLTESIGSFTNSGGVFSTNGFNTLIGTGNTITWSGGTNTITAGGLVQDNDWVISGGTNTVNGGTAGTLQVQTGATGLHFSGAVDHGVTLDSHAASPGRILLQNDVFVDNAGITGTAQILNGGAAAVPGTVDMGGGNRTFDVINGTATVDMLISARLANGALTKDGAGTLRLAGDNNYMGATTVDAGTLELVSPGVLKNGSIDVNAGTFQQTSGVNNVTGTGTGDLTIAAGAVGYQLQGGTLNFGDYAAGGTAWTPADSSTISLDNGSQFAFTGGSLLDVSLIDTNGTTFTQSGGNFYIGQNGIPVAAETTINGGYSLLGGTIYFDAFGVDPTPEQCCDGVAGLNDQLTVDGDLYLNSTVVFDDVGFNAEFGDAFTLFCSPNQIALGPNFGLSGGFFRLIDTGDPDHPFALQAIVPEPASVAVWTIIGLAGAAGAWRLRRKKQSSRSARC